MRKQATKKTSRENRKRETNTPVETKYLRLRNLDKKRMLRNNKMKSPQHLKTPDHRSLNNPTTTRKLKDCSPPWSTIMNITPRC